MEQIPAAPLSPDFVGLVTMFRIVVLTWNRPASLRRLLDSLERSDYYFVNGNPNWTILLEIKVDGGGGEEGARVEHLADTYNFSHGGKVVVKSETNIGPVGAWRNAWTWKDNELFIVLEDDVELSPHWYRALVYAWLKYDKLPEIAGVGLQKETYVWAAEIAHNDIDVAAMAGDSPVFLYSLPATIGSSPHPWHWAKMMQMFGDKLASCPEGMGCVKSVPEMWWLKYCKEFNLFTLYFSGQKALAVDHREAGVHIQMGLGSHSGRVEEWSTKWEIKSLPMQPVRLDLYLQQVSDMRLASMQLASDEGKVEVLVVTEENREMVTKQLRAWNKSTKQGMSRERLERLLFVSPVPISLPKPAKVIVETPSWLNTSLPLTPVSVFDFHIHILLHLTMQAVPVEIYPDLDLLITSSNLKTDSLDVEHSTDNLESNTSSANIVAGRKSGQTSPDLRWLATDGSFAAFDLFAKIDRLHSTAQNCKILYNNVQYCTAQGRQEGAERDFVKLLRRVVSASDAIGKPLTWSWGPVDFESQLKPLNLLF